MPYSMFRNASAAIPLGMSAGALIMVLIHIIATGTGAAPAADEDATAHLFQLLLAGQAPFVAFFAVKWLPRMPAEAMLVIAAQAAAALLALAPVVIFDL
jgi:hypothetical protein